MQKRVRLGATPAQEDEDGEITIFFLVGELEVTFWIEWTEIGDLLSLS